MASTRILCLVRRATHPTMMAQVDLLRQAGFQVEVMSFRGPFYVGRLSDSGATILGYIQNENYLKRLLMLRGAIPKVRAAIRHSQITYAFGADMALMALIAGLGLGRPMILNVMYLRPTQTAPGWQGKLMRAIDRVVIGRCRLLIIDSAGSYHHYFRGWLKTRKQSLLMETKIEASRARGSMPKNGVPLLDRPLVIGWFGVIRHLWSLEFLECLNRLPNGRFKVVIAGAAAPEFRGFDSFLHRNPDIKFCGSFQHPDDLPQLYGSVDMVQACLYPFPPESWHRSIRYYEACFFQKPLIVRPGEDAGEVEKHQVGLVLNEDSPKDAARTFSAITSDDWLRWRANMAALPRQHYMFTDEAGKLSRALAEILNN